MTDHKKILRHLYLMAKFHANSNRNRANDLVRAEDPVIHWKDEGLADAYEAMVFFLTRPELMERMNYGEIMKMDNQVPRWLQE